MHDILKAAHVGIHFKIAKIICNKVGWKLQFINTNEYKFKLYVPLKKDSELTMHEMSEEEEVKEGFGQFPRREEQLRP